MNPNLPVNFQWQNPVLRKTIYPFREKKLLDFLLIYKEIDLWRAMGKAPVDPKVAAELKQEHSNLQNLLKRTQEAKATNEQLLSALKIKHREALKSKGIRFLILKKTSLQARLASLEASLNSVKRRRDWYEQFAPAHPYFEKFSRDYELAKIPYDKTCDDQKAVTCVYDRKLATFETEAKSLSEKSAMFSALIESLKNEINRLPALDKNGVVTQNAAVRWLVLKYEQELTRHPAYINLTSNLETTKTPSEKILPELKAVLNISLAESSPLDNDGQLLNEKIAILIAQINFFSAEIKKLPAIDQSGGLTQKAAVLWLVSHCQQELNPLDHDRLLAAVLDRFDDQPERFPKWLQYMIIHFTGMRYQSSHASWANARDLLESLKTEELKARIRTSSDLDKEIEHALTSLGQAKIGVTDIQIIREIERQLNALKNPFIRQRALLEFQTAQAIAEIRKLTDQEILVRIKAMKDKFPEWVWKEIVSRTDLRLEVQDENWETLTPLQVQERWKVENQRWRAIMDAWEGKDITAWRTQHQMTLSLVVSRAVCNEIAEHIQHLRGIKPAAGLTAKPEWFLKNQTTHPGSAYFKRPMSTGDLRSGASILFLGWVNREPNAWQIAHPLNNVELFPISKRSEKVRKSNISSGPGDDWKYLIEGNKFIRTCQPFIAQPVGESSEKKISEPTLKSKVKIVKGPVIKEWLRWTHEATVVEVAEMATGTYVLTFETGQIGLNLRPLSRILNQWDIFAGYIPPAPLEVEQLDTMLDRQRIIPVEPTSAVEAPVAFGMPMGLSQTYDEGLSVQEIVPRWRALTRRQKQVVALYCLGNTVRKIATRLDTSTSTINTHLRNATQTFGSQSRDEMCAMLADWDFSDYQKRK